MVTKGFGLLLDVGVAASTAGIDRGLIAIGAVWISFPLVRGGFHRRRARNGATGHRLGGVMMFWQEANRELTLDAAGFVFFGINFGWSLPPFHDSRCGLLVSRGLAGLWWKAKRGPPFPTRRVCCWSRITRRRPPRCPVG